MFIFGDRDIQCSYFPNDRVLYDLRKKELKLESGITTQDTTGLGNALHRANVNFKRTLKEDVPCNVYFLEFEELAKTFVIENCDSIATLQKVEDLSLD